MNLEEITFEELVNDSEAHIKKEYKKRYIDKKRDHLCTYEWFKTHLWQGTNYE